MPLADEEDRSAHSSLRQWLLFSIPVAMAVGIAVIPIHPARAVPSYTEQTGFACSACHVGGFGPQLTPFGRDFKLNGYTMRTRKSVPLSAVAIASFNHTAKDQNPPPEHYGANDNLSFDEGAIFLAGGIGKHFGGFTEVTYEGAERHWALDMLDWRAVTKGKLFGEDTTFGLTLNNGPHMQDAWNTVHAWGFPYTESELAGSPSAGPIVGDLMGNTLGLSAYAWIGQKAYVEAGAYASPAAGTLEWFGVEPDEPGSIAGLVPYGRVAWQGMAAGGTLELGAFAFDASLYPERDMSSGFTDHYTDVGLDASWQKETASRDVISLQARYVHEARNLEASCALGLIGDGSSPSCADVGLDEFRGDVAYHWHNRLGLTVGGFLTSGDSNVDLYDGPAASPDSDGVTVQLDYSPWGEGNGPLGKRVNLQLGVQYTAYGKFDGASTNYDGAGANASDNNTLRVFSWLAF